MAAPFVYKANSTAAQKKKTRDDTLNKNEDTLYYNDRERSEKYNLLFKSEHVEEWIKAIKEKYPGTEEIKDVTTLHFEDSTICVYHGTKKFIVHGKILPEFEEDFETMREMILTEQMGKMNIKSDKWHPEEPEGDGTQIKPHPK